MNQQQAATYLNVPVERVLRRARLLAARLYPPQSICRRGIRSGQWDTGEVVRQFMVAAEVRRALAGRE